MSWFSVGMHGKNAWQFHGSMGRIISGEFISDFVYRHAIHHNPINSYVRSVSTNYFRNLALPKVLPASKDIAQRVITRTLTPEKMIFVKQRLLEKYTQSSIKQLALVGKEVAKLGFRNLTSRFFGANLNGGVKKGEDLQLVPFEHDSQAYNAKAIKFLKRGSFSDATLIFAESMLLPVCDQAVQKALAGMTKAAVESAYDLTLKKTCSLVVMPLMYSVFFLAMETLNTNYEMPIIEHQEYLPTPFTILSLVTAANALHLGKCIWDESKKHQGTVDLDKEEVKKLAFEKARKEMSQKLKENNLLTSLEMNKTQEDVDNLVKVFISELVDFYWKDLHETKVLGLSLVA